MSWNKRMEEMVGTWTDMQHKMWDNWLQTVNSFGGNGGQGAEAWKQEYRKNLSAWESSVRQALEAQNQWARNWADAVTSEEGAPEVVSRWALQMQEMMKGWTEAQTQLWSAWFDSVKHLDPAEVADRWDSEGQQVLQAWREATERAQEILSDLSRVAVTNLDEEQPARRTGK